MSDTNGAVQPQKMVRDLGSTCLERDCTIYVAKTKALINCAVNPHLICAFIFGYAKSKFSPYMAHLQ